MGLVSKIKYHSLLKDYFHRVSGYLSDGYYMVKDNRIIQTEKNLSNFYKIFRVRANKNVTKPYNEGKMFVTKYKYGLLTNDKAYYFIYEKDRYDLLKSNYEKYRNQLVYPAFDLEFRDENLAISAPIIEGTIYKDLSRFDAYLSKLFEYANKSERVYKDTTLFGSTYSLPWYVQHGDCKNGNIVWKDDSSFTMIDLEALDLYPPLYDVFYYLFITKKEESISILNSKEFINKIKRFYSNKLENVPENILDISLAVYANYTSAKLEKNSDLYEFEFYLYWRKYDSFDNFPLTKRVLTEYANKLKEYKIR